FQIAAMAFCPPSCIIPSCCSTPQFGLGSVVIQPPSFVVTIPGPILSASCDPVAIGGNTPCAAPGSGILGRPLAPSRGLLGGRNLQGGRGNVTLIPCGY
uniref:Uncharacterized protein n=1 Tax=Naja naja TaxID=35670 RepID=A0A8C6XRP7_NAJNA